MTLNDAISQYLGCSCNTNGNCNCGCNGENNSNSSCTSKPIELDDYYQMKVMIKGIVDYYKPVDFRMNRINIPLHSGDIEFIYDKCVKNENIYKNDVITKTFYPPASIFSLIDGTQVQVLEYGPVKVYNGLSRVTVYCRLVDETKTLVETIPNRQVLDKVLVEMNKILLSNEELKDLLPSYSYNWMLYNNEKYDNSELADSYTILNYIDSIEYAENFTKQTRFKELIEENYSSVSYKDLINELYEFSIDYIQPKYPVTYNALTKKYKMKSIANWLIYITEHPNKHINYDRIFLLNKYDEGAKVVPYISKNKVTGYDIRYVIIMPDESRFNYLITLDNVTVYDRYISYIIGDIHLYQIPKILTSNLDESSVPDKIMNLYNENSEDLLELSNASKQISNFKAFVEILKILSGYITDFTMSEYYENISKFISELNITNPSPNDNISTDPIPSEPSISEEDIEEIINRILDDKISVRLSELMKDGIIHGGDSDDILDDYNVIFEG